MKATYGVMGMMEWIALIPTGHNIVRVRFSGGSLSGYGVTPATFTTTNPVVMRMIERSSYFRRGKIRLVKKEKEDSDCDREGASPLDKIVTPIDKPVPPIGKPVSTIGNPVSAEENLVSAIGNPVSASEDSYTPQIGMVAFRKERR